MKKIKLRYRFNHGGFSIDTRLSAPGAGVTALFGQSGSGKTTILRLIAGLLKPSEGYLEVNGELIQDSARGIFLPPHKRRIGYAFQEPRLFPHLTVRQNLEYGFKRTSEDERTVEFDKTVEMLGVYDFLSRFPGQLSGGQKQRVAIARALLASPKLLLLDEPLASLDSASKSEIFPYLEKLHNELSIPVIYISHSIDEVARFADYIALVENGKVYASGELMDVLSSLDLPVSRGEDAGAVVEARVAGHEDRFHLTWLDFPGGRINIPRNDMPVGRKTRVRIIASDVAISVDRPIETSILNVFEAVIVEIKEKSPSQVMVKMDANGAPILARITKKSQSTLGLDVGKKCYAMVKSVAVVM
ncbi:Molybdenum ABC transporter ATP-binding protein ModC [hydrothermal vent metagenome]|uniref:Molybdenum ABC transporter ATP-binding protein ModC n=1 Tax=hydrothermal vent metagenome TaxID=652676 RepID=A0A3B1CV43_9ZZZZ